MLIETEVEFCQDIVKIICSSLIFILLEIHNDFMIKKQKFLAFHFCTLISYDSTEQYVGKLYAYGTYMHMTN